MGYARKPAAYRAAPGIIKISCVIAFFHPGALPLYPAAESKAPESHYSVALAMCSL